MEREYTSLTNKELEVLYLLLEGYTASQVGKKLNITEETVKSHRKKILAKYQARNMVHVATLFHRGIAAYEPSPDMPEIILATRLKYLLNTLMIKLESELNKELVTLLRKATKDSHF